MKKVISYHDFWIPDPRSMDGTEYKLLAHLPQPEEEGAEAVSLRDYMKKVVEDVIKSFEERPDHEHDYKVKKRDDVEYRQTRYLDSVPGEGESYVLRQVRKKDEITYPKFTIRERSYFGEDPNGDRERLRYDLKFRMDSPEGLDQVIEDINPEGRRFRFGLDFVLKEATDSGYDRLYQTATRDDQEPEKPEDPPIEERDYSSVQQAMKSDQLNLSFDQVMTAQEQQTPLAPVHGRTVDETVSDVIRVEVNDRLELTMVTTRWDLEGEHFVSEFSFDAEPEHKDVPVQDQDWHAAGQIFRAIVGVLKGKDMIRTGSTKTELVYKP